MVADRQIQPTHSREPDESMDEDLADFLLGIEAGDTGVVEAVTAAHADDVLRRADRGQR